MRYDGLSIITVNYQHDGLGRVTSETQGTGPTGLETLFEYDAADRPVVVKRRRDENDYTQTRYAYDLLGRRIAVTEADGTADARTTTFGYDRLGRMTSQTAVDTDPDPDQQQVTVYGYDLLGRRVQSVFPDSINQTSDLVIVEYDTAGRVMYRNAFGMQEASLEYDRRGLLKSRSLNPGAATSFYESFNYDGLGRMTEASRTGNDPLGYFSSIVGFGYNDLSNLMSEKQHVLGAGIKIFYYQYDQAGNRLCADCPDPPGTPIAATLGYTYNGINRMTAITRNGIQLASYDYASGGGLRLDKRQVTDGGQGVGVRVEYDVGYDEHGRLNDIANRRVVELNPSTLAQFTSTFDGVGNRSSVTETGAPGFGGTAALNYDSLDRLQIAVYLGGAQTTFEIFDGTDLLGNRDIYAKTRPPSVFMNYGPNNPANEYSTINTLSVSYDASGNLIRNEGGYTFDYDPDNRLIQVKDPTGAVLAIYAYDALGRRVREVKGGKTTYFYYDGQRVFAEYEKKAGEIIAILARYYVDGPMYVDEHVLMHEGGNGPGEGKDYFYLLGPLYTVVGLTDMSGNVVQAYSYDAYGDVQTMPAPPTVTAGGSRYLLVTPADQGDTPVALVVVGDSGCPNAAYYDNRYVQSKCAGGSNNGQNCLTDADCPKACHGGANPNAVCTIATDCPLGECVGKCDSWTLGSTPFYKLSSQWGTAKVRGGEIRPGTTYSVYTQIDLGGGAAFSSAAAAATWTWGDVDNNRVVNAMDVSNLVNALKGFWGSFTFEQMNLFACVPDSVINALDIAVDVDAVRGFAFPCSAPTSCGTSNFPPPNPYFFTGRRLDFDLRAGDPGASLGDLPPGTIAGSSVLTLYDYRAREYDARHGRFLQRDPAGYVDGANLYEYARGNPATNLDPTGLYSLSHAIGRKGELLLVKGIQSNPQYVILYGVGKATTANGPDLIVYNKANQMFEFFDNKAWARQSVSRAPQWMREFNAANYRGILQGALEGGVVPKRIAAGYKEVLEKALTPGSDRVRRIITPFGGSVKRIGAGVTQYGIEFMEESAIQRLGKSGAGKAAAKLCVIPIGAIALEVLTNTSVAQAAEIPTPEEQFLDIFGMVTDAIRNASREDPRGNWAFSHDDLMRLHEDFVMRGYLLKDFNSNGMYYWSQGLGEDDLDYINEQIRMDKMIEVTGLDAVGDGEAIEIGVGGP